MKVLRCCLKCLVTCLARCVKQLTSMSYIIIAMQGGAFCTSTRRAFILMMSQRRLLVMTNFVSNVLLSIITLSVAIFCAATTFIVLKFSDGMPNVMFEVSGIASLRAVNDPTLPTFVTFWFSYAVSEAFVDVLQTTIESVFVCYCADIKLNKKEGQLARSMNALEEIKQADAVVQDELRKTARAKEVAQKKTREADHNESSGKLNLTVSEPDHVEQEQDPTWLEEGGNGDPTVGRTLTKKQPAAKLVI